MTEAEVKKDARGRWLMTGALAAMILLPLAAMGGAAALKRVFKPSRSRYHRPVCKSNLRQIGLACHMYADDHDGNFPPGFQVLVPMYVDNPKVFSCPQGPSSWRDFNIGAAVRESSSYDYLPGRSPLLPGEFFLAVERNLNHGGMGFNVLFCDAHVEWRNAAGLEQFNKLLEAQNRCVERINADPGARAEAMEEYRRLAREIEGP